MSASANKALVYRYYEDLWNRRDVALADELFAPTFRIFPEADPGPGGVTSFVARLLAVLPDLAVRLDDLFAAENDTVVARFTITGTHQGEFLGGPATGKPVAITEITIWRIEGGKIVERWTECDALGVVQQLGARVVPAEPASP